MTNTELLQAIYQDVKELKQDVSGLKQDVSELKQRVGSVESQIKSTEQMLRDEFTEQIKVSEQVLRGEIRRSETLVLDEVERVHYILSGHIKNDAMHFA